MNDLHALAAFKALDEGRLQPVDKGVVVTQADVELLAQITEAGGNKAAAFTLRSVGAVGTVLEAQAKAIAHHRHQSETGAALTREGREAGSFNEKAVMVCPQCDGEGGYPDGLDEAACHTDCTRCDGNGWIVDIAALAQLVPSHEVGADGRPADDSDPWFQLGWHKDKLERAEIERDEWKERAMSLRLAQPVEAGEVLEERFLLAYVSHDTKVIGIEHPTEATWDDVMNAHIALRDRLNVRIAEQKKCPHGPDRKA